MGRPKLLLPWGDGTVLEATAGALLKGGAAAVVVVVAAKGPLAGWEPLPRMRRALNEDPSRGMVSSVIAGLAELSREGTTADPLLVCPADLPALAPSTVEALLAAYAEHGGVVVPRHGNKRGHPLVLAPAWVARVPELAAYDGGLRRILELAAGAVREVVVDDPGCLRDVDTPDEYEAMRPR